MREKNARFQAALSATRKKLSERGARIAAAMDRLQKAQVAFAQAERNRAVAEARLATLELRQKGVKQVIEEAAVLFAQHGFSAFPDSAQSARQLVLPKQEQIAQLERALYILEASGAHDRVTTLQGRLEQLRRQLEEESIKLAAAERAVEGSRQIDGAVDTVSNQLSMEQFDTVLPLLKELYQRLRPHADWREIETDFGGRVRASLNFVVGDGRNPQFIFSSGQRRAAGIAFLLAIHLSRPWSRLRSLLLDDPVQHIDDYRALNLVEVLSAIRRTGRQVIVAVEDPALADVLCRRLRSHAIDFGRRFEIGTSRNGSAMIADQHDVFPLPREVLKIAEAS